MRLNLQAMCLTLTMVLLTAAFIACRSKSSTTARAASYRADFNSPEDLADWKCYDDGKWDIRDGWLVADARTTTSRSILWLNRPLPNDIRIECEAECVDQARDLTFIIAGNGHTYSGYEIVIGGSENKRVVLFKCTKETSPTEVKRLARDDFSLMKDRTYTIRIRKYRAAITVSVNDEALLSSSDEQPLDDAHHRYFGFASRGNVVRFDSLRIEERK